MRYTFFLLALVFNHSSLLFAQNETTRHKVLNSLRLDMETIREEVLPNGLRIYLKPIPGASTVTTMTGYRVGAADENLDQTGLSHYLEHLMFKGTKKLVPGDIDRITLRNGGANNAYTSEDCTVYHFDFSADRWEQALSIEADRMRNLMVDDKHEFQQEKGAVIEELKRNEDGPWDLEYKAILPLLFGKNSPYGHPVIGETEHVKAATAEIIKRHYDIWYHPNNAVLVICGGFDPEKVIPKVRELFGAIPKADLPARKTATPMVRENQVRVEMKSKFEVPRLLMGFNTVEATHADAPALTILEALLADGKTSRLYRRFIEGDEIATEAGAEHSSGRYPGWFGIQLELLQGKDPKMAEKAVFEELEKIRSEKIGEEELSRVRQKVLATSIYARESVHQLADVITKSVVIADLPFLKGSVSRLLAVTPEDLQRVAKSYLDSQKAVLVWSIPSAKATGKGIGFSNKLFTRKLQRNYAPAGNDFSLKSARRVELPGGMVLLMQKDSRLPMVVARVAVRENKALEPKGKYGVASMTSSLMDEGIPGMGGQQIAVAMENLGASLEFDDNGGTLKILSADLKAGFDLMIQCLKKPTFPEVAFIRNQKQALSALEEMESQPDYLAKKEFARAIYGDHPRGRPSAGNTDSVKALTRLDCQKFHERAYQPANLILAVSGDFDEASIEKQVKDALDGWGNGMFEKPAFPNLQLQEKSSQKIVTVDDAVQMQFYMGHLGIRRKDPDYYKLLVMDHILGTGPGFTDRLSARLRDREGLAYTVNANITTSAENEPGAFTCYIGTDAVNFFRVKKEFLEEIERIRETLPTKQELEDAKNYLLGNLAFRFTSSTSIATQLIQVEKLGLGLDYLDEFRAEVGKVSESDIQVVAKKHLHPEKLMILAVGALDQQGNPLKRK